MSIKQEIAEWAINAESEVYLLFKHYYIFLSEIS